MPMYMSIDLAPPPSRLQLREWPRIVNEDGGLRSQMRFRPSHLRFHRCLVVLDSAESRLGDPASSLHGPEEDASGW